VERLIVGPSWLGDAVMMGSLVLRLKARDPAGRVTVLAPAYLEGLLARMPGVDATLANPFAHGALQLAERRRFGRALKGRFEQAIVLPHSFKSALIPFFAGVPIRTGFVGEARYVVLNDARRLDERRLPRMVDRFNLLAEPRGTRLPEAALAPRLEVEPGQIAATLNALGLTPRPAAVALCVGAEYGPAKRWPARHFAALARRLAAAGHGAWLLGSANDAPIGAEIEALAPGAAVNLIGRTDLSQAIDLIAAAAAVVSNDSGLMHVAAALDRPLVALYGSSSPIATPPLSDRAATLSENIPCSPCFERQCPLGHFKCLNDLLPDRVWAALSPHLTSPTGVGEGY
jgi:heptosyltransferase-2